MRLILLIHTAPCSEHCICEEFGTSTAFVHTLLTGWIGASSYLVL
jgi:hypothetical protein